MALDSYFEGPGSSVFDFEDEGSSVPGLWRQQMMGSLVLDFGDDRSMTSWIRTSFAGLQWEPELQWKLMLQQKLKLKLELVQEQEETSWMRTSKVCDFSDVSVRTFGIVRDFLDDI
ncbi:hypothetical protein RhiirA5_421838 [Rhizophagus irregularis]|uniref:Uncharacterized protein n=1 Tax=Rhizophagus irregularis TaxID=588596 RepID=A0A2N0PD34_9GLOM|nr:hypothetical protein RhiirA5_421838 [Rhizophagus irregularis]